MIKKFWEQEQKKSKAFQDFNLAYLTFEVSDSLHHWTVFSKAAIFRSLSGTERNVSQHLSSCSGCWYSFHVSKWRSCSLTFIWAATPSPDHFLWTFFLRHFSASIVSARGRIHNTQPDQRWGKMTSLLSVSLLTSHLNPSHKCWTCLFVLCSNLRSMVTSQSVHTITDYKHSWSG